MNNQKSIINDRILFLGIGIFLWLSVGSFSFLFQEIFKYFSIHLGLSPILILISKELIRLTIYLLGILFIIKIIKTKKLKSLQLFLSLIIILLIGQVLQFMMPIIMGEFFDEDYLVNLNEYYDFIHSEVFFETIPAIIEYIVYIVIGIIIYRNWNKFENLDNKVNQELNNIGKE